MERLDSLKTYEQDDVSTKFPDESRYKYTEIEDYRIRLPDDPEIVQLNSNQRPNETLQINLQGETIQQMVVEPNFDSGRIFSLCIDGSEDCEFTFHVLTKEFLKNEKILMTYVYDPQMEEYLNYRNQKETIINKYETLSSTQLNSKYYLFENLVKNNNEKPIELFLENSQKHNSEFVFFGYKGLRGPRGDNKLLTHNIEYLVNKSTLPTILIKEKTLRSETRIKGYKWLFVFDRFSSDCYKTLETFIPLIDPQKDIVELLTMLPSLSFVDDYKRKYINDLSNSGLITDNIIYNCEVYEKSFSKFVIEKVNFSERPFYNFVVFYNNSANSVDKKKDIINLVTNLSSNVCFIPRAL